MANSYFPERIKSPTENGLPLLSPRLGTVSSPGLPKPGALQSRISNVLSASYADLEIRDALGTLDDRAIRNTANTRRNLRLDVQQELIQCNGEIVKDFGQVAEVRLLSFHELMRQRLMVTATSTCRLSDRRSQQVMRCHPCPCRGREKGNRTCSGRELSNDQTETPNRGETEIVDSFQFPFFVIRCRAQCPHVSHTAYHGCFFRCT